MEPEVFLKSRDLLPQYFNQKNLCGRGVEVGVHAGIFSKTILSQWRGEKLYLVDTWRFLPAYNDIANNPDMYMNLRHYSQTFVNVYDFGERAVIIREDSISALELFQTRSLDFVYIDADHSYDGVLKDILLWYNKVKIGGVLCGDDFLDETSQYGTFGVKSAVLEFASKINKPVKITGESDFPSWVIEL